MPDRCHGRCARLLPAQPAEPAVRRGHLRPAQGQPRQHQQGVRSDDFAEGSASRLRAQLPSRPAKARRCLAFRSPWEATRSESHSTERRNVEEVILAWSCSPRVCGRFVGFDVSKLAFMFVQDIRLPRVSLDPGGLHGRVSHSSVRGCCRKATLRPVPRARSTTVEYPCGELLHPGGGVARWPLRARDENIGTG